MYRIMNAIEFNTISGRPFWRSDSTLMKDPEWGRIGGEDALYMFNLACRCGWKIVPLERYTPEV